MQFFKIFKVNQVIKIKQWNIFDYSACLWLVSYITQKIPYNFSFSSGAASFIWLNLGQNSFLTYDWAMTVV